MPALLSMNEVANNATRGITQMTPAEYAILSILIAVVGVSLWLGFLGRQF